MSITIPKAGRARRNCANGSRLGFTVRMGRWHDVPVGPHPTAMYQIHFAPDQFPTLVPFVMMNRMGLTVLLHPESGRPRDDHTLNATWMGEVLPLNTAILPETDRHG